ncbi:MAG: hypothetical protein HY289_11365 [Planctomycetes bacterium]|nr:hypothetical protein [Planctomycetota bacterium]
MIRIRLCQFGAMAAVLAVLCSMLSCKPPAKPGPAPETNNGRAQWTNDVKNARPGIDFAVVQYITWEDRIAFALWTDLGVPNGFPNELSSYLRPNHAGSEGRYSGSIQEKQKPGGPVIEFSCATTDGVNGSIKVDGRAFELANGFVLLVSTADGKVRAKQIKRDPLSVPPVGRPADVVNALDKLKADPEIIAFFAR